MDRGYIDFQRLFVFTLCAIADRLVENSEIFLLAGESLRKGNRSQPPTE